MPVPAPPRPLGRLVHCGDITYLKTGEGWLYLASVVDLSTRMVAGWSFSARMTADICVSALEMAERRGYVAGGAVFHSDRGPQYTSAQLAAWASANGVRLSVGRTGCCRDNAVAESLWASLKKEMCHRRAFETREEAKVACIDRVERFYNRSALGDRLQAPRRPDGRVPGEDGGDVQERGLPGGIASEILTHFIALGPREPRVGPSRALLPLPRHASLRILPGPAVPARGGSSSQTQGDACG